MSNVIGFPYGLRGTDNGPVEAPCECEDGVGYPLRPEILPEPAAEPTSSTVFPYARVINMADRSCHLHIQVDHERHFIIPVEEKDAADMVEALGCFLGRSLRRR